MSFSKQQIFGVAFAAILAISLVVAYFIYSKVDSRNVFFEFSPNVTAITLYRHEKDSSTIRVSSLKKSSNLRLKDGSYSIIPKGKNISLEPILFNVDGSLTKYKVNPYYSEKYLSYAFSGEINEINKLLRETYSDLDSMGEFNAYEGIFYRYGDLYGTTAYHIIKGEFSPKYYGIILQKINGKWEVLAPPTKTLRYGDYPNIPKKIIDAINEKTNSY